MRLKIDLYRRLARVAVGGGAGRFGSGDGRSLRSAAGAGRAAGSAGGTAHRGVRLENRCDPPRRGIHRFSTTAIAAASSNSRRRNRAGCGSSTTAALICRWKRGLRRSSSCLPRRNRCCGHNGDLSIIPPRAARSARTQAQGWPPSVLPCEDPTRPSLGLARLIPTFSLRFIPLIRWRVARILYPALLTATLALAAALCLGPATANRLLSVVGVVQAQSPGGAAPAGGYRDGRQLQLRIPSVDPYNHIMTSAPTQPMPVGQPQNWAGGNAANSNPRLNPAYVPPPGAPPAQALDSALVVLRVGPMKSHWPPTWAAGTAPIWPTKPPEPRPNSLPHERQELIVQLKNLIDVKLLFVEATKTIPEVPLKDVQAKINDQFDKVASQKHDGARQGRHASRIGRRVATIRLVVGAPPAGLFRAIARPPVARTARRQGTRNRLRDRASLLSIPRRGVLVSGSGSLGTAYGIVQSVQQQGLAYQTVVAMGNDVLRTVFHLPKSPNSIRKARPPTRAACAIGRRKEPWFPKCSTAPSSACRWAG